MEQIVRLEELSHFAKTFWQYVNGATVFAFHGDMGAGKTTIITALCNRKGVQDVISSPTFSIINEYIYEENGVEKSIYHIDLYRLKNSEEVIQAGVEDCINSGHICFIEWPEKAPELFDENTVYIYIDLINSTTRRVKIEAAAALRHNIA